MDVLLLHSDTVTTLTIETGETLLLTVEQQGPAGAGDRHYTHTQAVPASVWTVAHNLGKRPAVTVVDSSGREVEGDVQHGSATTLTITFSAAFSGTAYCN